jgi:hypothetical protein
LRLRLRLRLRRGLAVGEKSLYFETVDSGNDLR